MRFLKNDAFSGFLIDALLNICGRAKHEKDVNYCNGDLGDIGDVHWFCMGGVRGSQQHRVWYGYRAQYQRLCK
jgi:hypothetical protein